MLYISRKKSVGEHFGNQHTNLESRQNGGIPKRQQNTAESVAKETGVSPRTIANDAAYAEADQLTQSVLCHDPHRRTQLR